MAIVRWDPAREVDSLQSEVNRVFDAFFGGGSGAAARRWVPPVDLVETDERLLLKMDLPGLDKDDVSIEIRDGVLTVSGERRAEHEHKSEGYHRVERAFGSFSRSLSLPDGVAPDGVEASFDKGVLEVRVPKPEERKPHRVQIGAASVNGTAREQ
jgi:HSP20 family protein